MTFLDIDINKRIMFDLEDLNKQADLWEEHLFFSQKMKRLGNLVIGPTNNYLRRHGIRMNHKKRYPHERKYLPKIVRYKYHIMKNVGCSDALIYDNMIDSFDEETVRLAVCGKKK